METKQVWKMSYSENGGYDCTTDAIEICEDNRLVFKIDRADYDGVHSWDDEAAVLNEQMVKDAEFIVKACNEHEELAAIKETVADTLAMLHAPGFDNNGGPSNIADEVRVLLDNLNELEKERAQIYALLCGEENINGKENT